VDKIVLGGLYGVESWMRAAFKEVCKQKEWLSDVDCRRLGLENVIKIAKAREAIFRRISVAKDERDKVFVEMFGPALEADAPTEPETPPHSPQSEFAASSPKSTTVLTRDARRNLNIAIAEMRATEHEFSRASVHAQQAEEAAALANSQVIYVKSAHRKQIRAGKTIKRVSAASAYAEDAAQLASTARLLLEGAQARKEDAKKNLDMLIMRLGEDAVDM
jgi:hypothetical protein